MRVRLVCVLSTLALALAAAQAADDVIFLHHSVGENWLNNSLRDALVAKSYIDECNEITYGTSMQPDASRPASLGDVPGDNTNMNHWVLWFNDYLGRVKTYDCDDGFNRIIMFKSCFPTSEIWETGVEPGDPFDGYESTVNYKAVYRHPGGAGQTYALDGNTYRPLEDIFAQNPNILFVPVTAPPLDWGSSSDENAHRARLFNNWLKNDWLTSYRQNHPGLNNVAVFDFFDLLAYPDNHPTHPNRLKGEYGGNSGDSHPNDTANAYATQVFATNPNNFLDQAWAAFIGSGCTYAISPTSRSHPAAGGSDSVQVTADAGCAWTAVASDAWLAVSSGGSGTGNGIVQYTVAANPSPNLRTGKLVVAGLDFTVNQAGVLLEPLFFPAGLAQVDPLFQNTYLGLAVLNSGAQSNQVTVAGLDPQGLQRASVDLTPPLGPWHQRAFLSTEVIGEAPEVRAVMLQGKAGPVRGFFLVGDYAMGRLDGAAGRTVEARTLYFPVAQEDVARSTVLFLFNPSPTQAAQAVLKLLDRQGALQKQANRTIASRGCLLENLKQIFDLGGQSADGYVQVASDVNLRGCEFWGDAQSFASLRAQTPSSSGRQYAPHWFVGGNGGDTELRMLNAGPVAVSVRVRAYDDAPTQVGEQQVQIQAGQLWVGRVSSLFAFNTGRLGPADVLSGYLDLEVDAGAPLGVPLAPMFVGAVTFLGNPGRFQSALPLATAGNKETLFLHVAQSPEARWFTGLAVLNTGTQAADVRVRAYGEDGVNTALKEFVLQPGRRLVGLLDDPAFFGRGFKQMKGHFRLSSPQPVMAFALFGDYGSEFLSAVEGQAADDLTF
jgi:hypothetical protein